MPQLLKSDYFSSTTVDTVDTFENNNINYSNVLPYILMMQFKTLAGTMTLIHSKILSKILQIKCIFSMQILGA